MLDPDTFKRGAQAAVPVTQMTVSTVLGGGMGHWLDVRFETAPWLMVTGFILGFAIGMVALFRTISRLVPDDLDDKPPDSS